MQLMIVCNFTRKITNVIKHNFFSGDNSIQNEPKSQLSISQSDKKSVKNILSQFLPSSTPPAIIPVCS